MSRPARTTLLNTTPRLEWLEDRITPVSTPEGFVPTPEFPRLTPSLGDVARDAFISSMGPMVTLRSTDLTGSATQVQLFNDTRGDLTPVGDRTGLMLSEDGDTKFGRTRIDFPDEGYYVVRQAFFPPSTVRNPVINPLRVVLLIDSTDPEIDPISDIVAAPNAGSVTVPFQISDNFTSAVATTAFGRKSLIVAATSSNEQLTSSVIVTGTGGQRSVQITPRQGATGTAIITINVTDEALNVASETFTYRVRRNGAPTITPIADQTIMPSSTTGPLTFTLGDDNTPAAQLLVRATSSNGVLVPPGGVVIAQTGADRTITVTPEAGRTGVADITLAVTDANELTTTTSFRVTVRSVNGPTITPLGDLSIQVGETVPEVTFDITDDTPTSSLTPSIVSSNPALLDADGIRFTVVQSADLSTSRYQLILTPKAGQTGATTIVIAVTDGDGLTATESFVLNVGAPPAAQRTRIAVVGAGANSEPRVRAIDGTGKLIFDANVFEDSFTGGVRVAVGDINGDGTDDIIAAAGPLGQSRIRILNGIDGKTIADFYAFDLSFFGGATVSAGDLDGDGFDDVVVGTASNADFVNAPDFFGAGPRVRIFSGKNLTANGSVISPVADLGDFFAYNKDFRGGVRVAVGDVNNDGVLDIVTTAGPSGAPEVRVFDIKGNMLSKFMAFEPSYLGGLSVSALNGAVIVAKDSFPNFKDSFLDQRFNMLAGIDGKLLTGSATVANLTAPATIEVYTFQGNTAKLSQTDTVLGADFRGGVRVAAGEYRGQRGVIIASGPGGGGEVQFRPAGPSAAAVQLAPPLLDFAAFTDDPRIMNDPGFLGGVYAAVAAERVNLSR